MTASISSSIPSVHALSCVMANAEKAGGRIALIKASFLQEGTPTYGIRTKYWLAGSEEDLDLRAVFEDVFWDFGDTLRARAANHFHGPRDTSVRYSVWLSEAVMDCTPAKMLGLLNRDLPCIVAEAVTVGERFHDAVYAIKDLPSVKISSSTRDTGSASR
jgi:hypothetical protein